MNATTLDEAARRRGLAGLLVYTFFMVTGFALLMPLVAVHFVNNAGLAAAAVGGALAVRQVMQQGLAVAGGMLADRFGIRPIIAAGVLLRAIGFASLALADDMSTLIAAMALSALGGALFEAPYQAAIAALTTAETRPRYYALSNWISGAGGTLGPLLGVWLLRWDFSTVCAIAAACFLLNFAVALLLLPRLDPPQRSSAGAGLGSVARDRRFVTFVVLMSGYWFVAVQINISLPLFAERLAGAAGVGSMFALSAGLTLALQYGLANAVSRKLAPAQMLACGMAGMTLGAALCAMASSFSAFLAGIVLFALGAILSRPSQQTLIAGMADARALGTYLGISSLSLAIGGGAGNIAGGWLAEQALRHPWLPGMVLLAAGVATTLALYRFGQWEAVPA